jgi:predicted amidohydrolase YtcJ
LSDGNNILVLRNARIYADFEVAQTFSSMAIRDGRVIALSAEPDPPLEGDTSIDLQNHIILPGLIDAHIHLEQYARHLDMLNCELPTEAACLDAVQARAQQLPPGSWILGHGWNQNRWGGYGSLDSLDRAAPDHPVYLTAKSLHAAWVNSQALQLASIDQLTADPANGHIQRDAESRPTGILFEAAMRLVKNLAPAPDSAELAALIKKGQSHLTRLGLVAVHDFDGPACFDAIQILRDQGQLDLRIVKNIPGELLPEVSRIGLRSGFGDDWIRIGNVKVFADGALGPRTAAMIDPYRGEPENLGMLLLDQEQLSEIGISAADAGFGMTVHAIGDRANHEVLDALAILRSYETQQQLPARRHRIEHLQVLHPDDLPRPASLEIVASMQPIHATSDMKMADQFWGERVHTAYAWRSQLDMGAQLAFGSDAPVEDPNPWWGVHAAVARGRRGDKAAWIPEQRLSLQAALMAYTHGPAYAAGLEDRQGRLLPGYNADLIVLEMDPFELAPDDLAELKPLGTMVDGEWRFRDF